MSRYLIDTHILLWWLSYDKKLPLAIKRLIEDADNQIMVSIISLWEISIKKSLGKLESPDNLIELLHENSVKIVPITVKHVRYIETLPFIHKDPFDRMLIAQCAVEDLIFITPDTAVAGYKINQRN